MTEQQIKISPIGRDPLPIIIQGINLPIGQGHPPNTLAIAIIPILILVDIITEMDHVIDRVLAGRVSKRIEESKGEIRAAVDGQTDFRDEIGGGGSGFGAADGTGYVGGAADAELIVVVCVWA